MAQTNLSMNNTTEAVIGLNFLLFISHVFYYARVFLFVLSLLYVMYNLRVQINAAGGLIQWCKNWKQWKL